MSGCKMYETTNEALAKVEAQLEELISWARADAEHALDSGATETAADDEARGRLLTEALNLVKQCSR